MNFYINLNKSKRETSNLCKRTGNSCNFADATNSKEMQMLTTSYEGLIQFNLRLFAKMLVG